MYRHGMPNQNKVGMVRNATYNISMQESLRLLHNELNFKASASIDLPAIRKSLDRVIFS